MSVVLALAIGAKSDRRVIETAAQLAIKLGGVLDVLFVHQDPSRTLPFTAEGLSGAVMEEVQSAVLRENETRQRIARAAFEDIRDSIAKDADLPCDWQEITGEEGEALGHVGLLSDLIVMAQPGQNAVSIGQRANLEAALMDTKRPVVLLPADLQPAKQPHTILVAWNETPESATALTSALPLLEEAKKVVVVTVSNGNRDISPDGPVNYLKRHGIDASPVTLNGERSATEELLLKAISDHGADMLVMGAYSHSRMREFFFGGVTEYMISHAPVPVLIAH